MTEAVEEQSEKKEKRMSKSTLVLLFLALLYSVLALYTANLLPLRLIKGTSMEPTFRAGDIVLVKKIPFSRLQIGDVIAYKTPDAARASPGTPPAILHRIIRTRIDNDELVLTTKGDNSDVDPWPVTASSFQGVQILRIPFLALPIVFLSSPKGLLMLSVGTLITLLYFPAMIIFHTLVIKPRREGTTALAVRGGALPFADAPQQSEVVQDSSVHIIMEGMDKLTSEQEQVRNSLLSLSESISFYAANLTSHTEVVQSLADVTQMLKGVVEQQGTGHGRRTIGLAIMVVDDQELFRQRAKDVLEMDESEFRVIAEAGDGAEALELMEHVRPDVVLMDVQMPNMDGFEATRRIQEQYPGTVIALVSMNRENEYDRMADEAGAQGFLSKKDLSISSLRHMLAAPKGESE